MKTSAPKVSVCIPTYNYAKYLPGAIESVLKQNYDNYELIIIDNCSTDNSANVINEYAKKDQRIVFKNNDHNLGMVNNWNLCLKYAKGEYIKFLFGDDLFASNTALERMVSVLKDDDVALVATSRTLIDEKSNYIKIMSEYTGERKYQGLDVISNCLIETSNRIGEPSVAMFRKKDSKRGFDGRYRQLVDLEMWFHILEQGNFYYIDEPLCSFRVHEHQQTKINIDNCLDIDDSSRLLEDYSSKPYIKLSRLEKEYMFYFNAYGFWKLYKRQNKISKELAIEKINKHYSFTRLFLNYPLYKFFKLKKKLKRSLRPKVARIKFSEN